jgi:hypothetical protein
VPLVEITYESSVTARELEQLRQLLPHAVSVAVDCPEEPYVPGTLRPGDVDLRFHERGEWDAGGLDIVVEVRSKWTASRADSRQARADGLHEAIADAVDHDVGVFLQFPVAAWSEG